MEDPAAPVRRSKPRHRECVVHADTSPPRILHSRIPPERWTGPPCGPEATTKLRNCRFLAAGHALDRWRANVSRIATSRARGFHLWRCDGCFRKLPYPHKKAASSPPRGTNRKPFGFVFQVQADGYGAVTPISAPLAKTAAHRVHRMRVGTIYPGGWSDARDR